MNKIKTTIQDIKIVKEIYFITLKINEQYINILNFNINNKIKIGDIVYITIKSTNIALSKNLPEDISITNRLNAKIIDINNGEILTAIKLDIDGFILESIITTKAYLDMNLNIDDKIIALIKSNEITIC
ncbi:Molybdate-binding domain of ModE [hydrothermal vent metagenome]|uniref:Molybdate-binding domain of ModE n=1 Tax=hydrothermal vent metagenome TaxID=652676 RepID=A0A1W1C6Z5_9ZZZZ